MNKLLSLAAIASLALVAACGQKQAADATADAAAATQAAAAAVQDKAAEVAK